MYLHLSEDEPAYVGSPKPEIDAAWADLTQGALYSSYTSPSTPNTKVYAMAATEIWVDGDEAKDVL
jgi:hypothetical protein